MEIGKDGTEKFFYIHSLDIFVKQINMPYEMVPLIFNQSYIRFINVTTKLLNRMSKRKIY